MFNSSLKSLSQLKPMFPAQVPWDRGGKFIQMIQVSFCSFCCQPPGGGGGGGGAGPFSVDFTTNLARQCRAFSKALKIEKLKAPLIRGPKGAGATNDWCIKRYICNERFGRRHNHNLYEKQ